MDFHESTHNEIYFLHVKCVPIKQKLWDAPTERNIELQNRHKHATEIFIAYTHNGDLVAAMFNLLQGSL